MAASELIALTAGSVKGAEKLLVEDGETQIKTPRGDRGVTVLLDFGREVFGNVEVGIAGSGSGIIDLGYSELLEDGRVKPNRGEMKYSDRIVLKKGRLDWQSFEPRAFRYIQIEFRWCSKAVELEYVRVNQTTYPAALTASFECSDSLLNDIWNAGAYTAHLCMNDTFVNSPWRDRAQWWADARIVSRVAYYAFNDTKLLEQGLRQFADSQKPDGRIAAVYPSSTEQFVPDTSLFWVLSVLEHYAFTDDAEVATELYPAVKRLLRMVCVVRMRGRSDRKRARRTVHRRSRPGPARRIDRAQLPLPRGDAGRWRAGLYHGNRGRSPSLAGIGEPAEARRKQAPLLSTSRALRGVQGRW